MKDPRIPLYLITGFLDSGKTTLLTDTLNMDYFSDGQRTVLLMCEDGETEYDPEQLSRLNTRLVPVQDQAQLNTSFLQEIDRRYQPERVLLEYNGMWPIQILRDLKLPKTWGLYQAIDVIDGSTFEMYQHAVHGHRHGHRGRYGPLQPLHAGHAPVRLEALHPGGKPHVRDRL